MNLFVYGGEGDCHSYASAIEAAGGRLWYGQTVDQAKRCDALLLPGGGDLDPGWYGEENRGSNPPDSLRDLVEWKLLAWFVQQKRPVLGICRGLQIINVFFGGTLHQDISGHAARFGKDRLHPVRTVLEARKWLPEGIVNSSHHQAVNRLGTGLRILQLAPDGVVEALCHETLPVLAVQWHPERLRGPLTIPETVNGNVIFDIFLKKFRKTVDREKDS